MNIIRNTPFGGRPISVRVCQVVGIGMLLGALAQPALASSVAFVKLSNCGDLILQGPVSAGGTNTGLVQTGPCASTGATAAGDASFVTGDIDLALTSVAGRGLLGLAYLDDYLTFHVAAAWAWSISRPELTTPFSNKSRSKSFMARSSIRTGPNASAASARSSPT